MRKSLIAKQVEYFYNLMELNISDKSSGGNSYKIINNWYAINTALYKINDYPFVGHSVQDIFDLGASFQSSAKTISIVSGVEYNTFITKFNIVKAKCEAVIDSYNLEDDSNDLYVKLPNNLSDLDCLSSIVKELDLSFNKCPILNEKVGNIQFKKVEEGSSWLVLTIGCIVAGAKSLDWIANYIKSCNEIRIQTKTIKNLDLDNILKAMEIEEKEQSKLKEKVNKNEEQKIKSACLEKFKCLDLENRQITPEEESRIVHCMKSLAELLDDGIEIYPSFTSKEETKNLFPKKEEFKMIQESQKLLGDSTDNKE